MNKTFDKKLEKVTRFEVIDDEGRVYVTRGDNKVQAIQFQDEGRTLKVFINGSNIHSKNE